jgi:hypothetical protein
MQKNAPDQKKTLIITAFGIVVVVLAGINRFFLDDTVMSGIVVILSIIFLVALVWLYISSRRAGVKAQPKGTEQKPKK